MRRFTGDDFMSHEIIAELNRQMQELALMRGVSIISLATGQGILMGATIHFFNSIERNIDALAGSSPPMGMQPTRTWLGEYNDVPLLSYRDVNRWFESVELIRAAYV